MSYVMPRTNSILAAFLIVLGLAVLARVAVISQHAYAVLLPPVSGNDLGPATAAVATDQTKPLLATIDIESAAPLVQASQRSAQKIRWVRDCQQSPKFLARWIWKAESRP